MILALVIMAAAAVLFISGWLRPDLIALLVPVALYITGVIGPEEVFKGFTSSAVILLIAAFVITEAIRQTGLGEILSAMMVRKIGQSERSLLFSLSLSAAFLSLFMNNIAAAAVLMPSAISVMRRVKASPRRLLLPMAFATQLAGMATLLTTSNIVMSSILRNHGLPAFGFLDFLPIGGPIAVIGLGVMIWLTPRLLKCPSEMFLPFEEKSQFTSLADLYGIRGEFYLASVLPDSPLVGSTILFSGLRRHLDINIVAIYRSSGQVIFTPGSGEQLYANDCLIFTPSCPLEKLKGFGLEADSNDGRRGELMSKGIGFCEAIIAPRSSLANKTLRQMRFRERYGLTVIAIWRNGQPIRQGIKDLPLQFGDALLLHGTHSYLKLLETNHDLIVLAIEECKQPPQQRLGKAWMALGIIAVTIALAATGWFPVAETIFIGALLLIVAGQITMDEAYEAIDWRSIVLVGGMLPIGTALNKTGAADHMAKLLIKTLGRFGPLALLAGFSGLTALLTQFIPGGATVPLIIGPIAISAGLQAGADPRALAMAVALATSTSFLAPFSHPVNLLVMGPGGYQGRDYVRIGLPLVVLTIIMILLLVPLFYPLHGF